ncbi:hypothetical protein BDR22DRAFT_919083 [Usnea florida]
MAAHCLYTLLAIISFAVVVAAQVYQNTLVLGSSTVSNRTMNFSALSSTRFRPIHSSSATMSASLQNTSTAGPQRAISPLSTLRPGNLSIGARTSSTVTSDTLVHSRTLNDTTSLSIPDLYSLSFNTPATSTATMKLTSYGSATTLTSANSSSLLHRPSNVISSNTRAETLIVSSKSTALAELASATAHSNSTTSGSTLSSLFSSPSLIGMLSSRSVSLSSKHSTAALTTISTMKGSGINSLTAIPYVAIPTTPLSPNGAVAIAGGVAIAEGLAFLSAAYLGISDVAALEASKTELIDSIVMLKSNLERLSLDLGGDGDTSCTGSKSRFRHMKRSVLSGLLDIITRARCSLTTTQMHLDQVDPDLDLIKGDLATIGGLANEMANEEEEEEEEEKKESQSAEDEKASETASSRSQSPTSTHRISTTYLTTSASSIRSSTVSSSVSSAISSVPDSLYDGPVQVDPANYTDSDAVDEAILALAGAALQAAMVGSSNVTTDASNLNTSMTARTGLSFSTTSTDSKTLAIPDKGKPGKGSLTASSITAVASVAPGSRASSIPAASTTPAASVIKTSAISAASAASAVSVIGASYTSAASEASAESSLRASSVSAASASAASFPSQIASNHDGSSLCKSLGGNSSCVSAYQDYNPEYKYTRYTSYVDTVNGFKGEWLGWGCAAMFRCNSTETYAEGMTGHQILNAFTYLYAEDGVGVCGSVFMDNGCYLTVDACDSCESSIPCDALPAQYQPPNGGVRCYYQDGTTWPPTPEVVPEGGGVRQQDKRDAH